MNREREGVSQDPQMQQAVAELRQRIQDRYPTTSFAVRQGIDDPKETWLVATVDLDDPDEVIDLVVDRLLELQIDKEVPLHVLPIHTPERVASQQREQAKSRGKPLFSRQMPL